MAKTVKLADIAERVGVSIVTVSKALSGQKGVSETMRSRIQAIADEMGYKQPGAYRREMEEARKMRGYNLGVLIADYYLGKYESFYSQMYQQFATRAGSKGCFCLLELVSREQEAEVRVPMMLSEKRVDGIVVIGKLSDGYLKMLLDSGIPMVGLDFYTRDDKLDSIISDSYFGGYRMTNYLIDKGHTQIAYVGTIGATTSITDRYMGYLKALNEHGIKQREDWIIDDRDPVEKILDESNIKLPEQMPTAFMCNSDQTAGMLINVLERAGYKVPRDISVAAYDNFLPPGICDVRITSYDVDMKEMAKRAVSLITHKIAGENYKQGTYIVGGHIIEKESVRETKLRPLGD
ncbi:MAG: LacI family DNA-binding transcriptional regulator [Lachnospiraceae bacterium]|nr:LacI family DNA-binding transcriptional regulator [Lachnospiraceae bacterium]